MRYFLGARESLRLRRTSCRAIPSYVVSGQSACCVDSSAKVLVGHEIVSIFWLIIHRTDHQFDGQFGAGTAECSVANGLQAGMVISAGEEVN